MWELKVKDAYIIIVSDFRPGYISNKRMVKSARIAPKSLTFSYLHKASFVSFLLFYFFFF